MKRFDVKVTYKGINDKIEVKEFYVVQRSLEYANILELVGHVLESNHSIVVRLEINLEGVPIIY